MTSPLCAERARTVASIPDADLVRLAVCNAHVGRPKNERWVHVKAAFVQSDTSAWRLCKRFDLDPYEMVGEEPEEVQEEG